MIIKIRDIEFDTLDVKFDLSTKDGYKTILYDEREFDWTVEEYKEIHRQIKARKPGELV